MNDDRSTRDGIAEADAFDDMCDSLEALARSVSEHFAASWRIDYVELMPQADVAFRAYVFFLNEAELSACAAADGLSNIREYVNVQLESLGLGKQGEIDVAFEFDSRENVERNFGGSYLMRMS